MKRVRIGLAGFGTVGGSVYRYISTQAGFLESRSGVRVCLSAIAVRDPGKKRSHGIPLPRSLLVKPEELVARPDVDIVVELMGGCGMARKLVLESLKAGKPVVTANKALLAEHGEEVFTQSNRSGTPIFFEASVAGGIPLIQSLKEGLVANRLQLIYGIVNGTCNYILSSMSKEKLSFEKALAEAQAKGYAEADPSFDIDGIDAAHKAAVVATLASGGCVKFKEVHVEGIRNVSAADIQFAHQLGYEIKLLAIIRGINPKSVEVRVHPTLIPSANHLASIHGVTNSMMVRGDVVGDIEFSGPGAGGPATASAVISDIVQAASSCGRNSSEFNGTTARIRPVGPSVAAIESVVSRYYLRLTVTDRPGVMAQITSVLGRAKIGISSVIQPEGHEGETVPLIFMIHDAPYKSVKLALSAIRKLNCVKAAPIMFRVETFGK
jgi:homoserine dehydrogenase